jgi:hypothetical protein
MSVGPVLRRARGLPALERAARLPLPEMALLGLMVVAALVLLDAGRGFTFYSDEWSFILGRRTGTIGGDYLVPHNEHFSAVPAAVYKLLFATAGLESYRPYQVVLGGLHLAVVALLYLLARPRVGSWVALLAATLILFYGEGWEDTIWPFQIGFVASLAAGLGALLALDRRDRLSDGAAAALLFGALASSGIGAPFVAAALVEVLWERGGWRRLWVVGAPFALYVAWYARYGKSALEIGNAPEAPEYAATTLSATLGTLAGLGEGFGTAVAVAAACLLAWRLGPLPAITPRAAAALTALLVYLAALGLSRPDQGPPNVSRYMYPCAIFAVLLAVELLRGVPVRPRVVAVAAALVAISAISNLEQIDRQGTERRGISDGLRARLAAVEVARDTVDPGYRPDKASVHVHLLAGPYLDAVDDLGSPAYSVDELPTRSEPARAGADATLVEALRIRPALVPRERAATGRAPSVEAAEGGAEQRTARCARFRPHVRGATLDLTLAPGGLLVRPAGPAPVEVRMRRFAGLPPNAPFAVVRPGTAALIAIPRDRSTRPWRVRLSASDPVEACGTGEVPA